MGIEDRPYVQRKFNPKIKQTKTHKIKIIIYGFCTVLIVLLLLKTIQQWIIN
jgi:hypothetical protein